MSATITYQGNTQTIENNPFTLKTLGKYCEDNIFIHYSEEAEKERIKFWTIEIPERPTTNFTMLIPNTDEWLSKNIWKNKDTSELNDNLIIMLFPIQFKAGETLGTWDCVFTIKSQTELPLDNNTKGYTLVSSNHNRLNRNYSFNQGEEGYELFISTDPENENFGALQYISWGQLAPGTYQIIAFIQN